MARIAPGIKTGRWRCKNHDNWRVGRQPYWLCHGSRISHGTKSI